MAEVEKDVMEVLLKMLLDRKLIAKYTYDGAVNMVHSAIDIPSVFWYGVCCPKEGDENGSS